MKLPPPLSVSERTRGYSFSSEAAPSFTANSSVLPFLPASSSFAAGLFSSSSSSPPYSYSVTPGVIPSHSGRVQPSDEAYHSSPASSPVTANTSTAPSPSKSAQMLSATREPEDSSIFRISSAPGSCGTESVQAARHAGIAAAASRMHITDAPRRGLAVFLPVKSRLYSGNNSSRTGTAKIIAKGISNSARVVSMTSSPFIFLCANQNTNSVTGMCAAPDTGRRTCTTGNVLGVWRQVRAQSSERWRMYYLQYHQLYIILTDILLSISNLKKLTF